MRAWSPAKCRSTRDAAATARPLAQQAHQRFATRRAAHNISIPHLATAPPAAPWPSRAAMERRRASTAVLQITMRAPPRPLRTPTEALSPRRNRVRTIHRRARIAATPRLPPRVQAGTPFRLHRVAAIGSRPTISTDGAPCPLPIIAADTELPTGRRVPTSLRILLRAAAIPVPVRGPRSI